MISNEVKFIGKYHIGQHVIIESGVEIGDGVQIGDFVIIRRGVKIESGVRIMSFCEIQSESTIRQGVQIGQHSVIESGVEISQHSVIDTLSRVKSDIPEWTHWSGNPLVFLGHLKPQPPKPRPQSNK